MSGRSRKAARAAAERKRKKERSFRDDQGRLHLVLHRDPASGRELVTLKTPLFGEDWQNEVATGAANTVLGVLGNEPSLERVLELTRKAMESTSKLTAGFLARAAQGPVACKAGCDHCCYQVVGVTAAEALTIFDHLTRTRTAEELEQLRVHVRELHQRSRGLSSAERFSPEHPCVFLAGGSCTIYEVRPLSCRGVNSLDAAECETRLRDPDARAEFLAKGHGGKSYLEPIRAFRAISAGLQLGLKELYHLDTRALDLSAVMHLLLTGDASLPNAWMSGQQPFASALSGAQ